MGLADAFSAEDRVDVKFSDFYNIIKNCSKQEMLINAIKARVPYPYIEAMLNGKKPEDE